MAAKKKRQMRTNGYIARLFLEHDKGTIVRKQNLRRVVKQHRVYNHVSAFDRITYIDIDKLLKTLNPAGIVERVDTYPRVRTLEQCVELIQRFDDKKNWVIENFFFTHDGFFKYFYGNKWIVNYDEFEKVYIEHLNSTEEC